MLVGLVKALRLPISSEPAMLSAGSPVDLSVIASIERQVSFAYVDKVRVSLVLACRDDAAAVGGATPRPAPTATTVVAATTARIVRRRFMRFSRARSFRCSLDAGHRDALHDAAMQDEEDRDDRDHHDDCAGEQQAVLRGVLADGVERESDRQGVLRLVLR